MPKLKLDRTYIHGGKRYGPGETEVPDEAAKDITAKMEAAAQATPPPRLDSTAAGTQHPTDGATAVTGMAALEAETKQASKKSRK